MLEVRVRKLRLRDARAQLGLTQRELAERAGIARQPVYNAEHNIAISPISAWAILNAINEVREERRLPLLEFEQIQWKIQGDGVAK